MKTTRDKQINIIKRLLNPNTINSVKAVLVLIITILISSISTLSIAIADDTTEIKVDKTAPTSNQPGIDKAPNNVPLVNIVAPSAKGVSHNKFDKFGVKREGVILNNSLEFGKSKLGGMVYGNPNLQPNRRAADIVLNEVTGVTETSLFGVTEMFGKSAEYVLANPNGIIVSGAGFINIPRVTLTTGIPQIDEFGDLQGLEVDQGMIIINEATLNGENIDALEIISRAAKIEQAIRAGKYLGIKTGRNHYDYKDKTLTPKADDGSEKPIVAIDAALLGGMYAGRIFLIATEKGVGVNSEDGIGANIEDVTITANGDVVLKKDIAAKRDVKIEAQGDIKQEGDSFAERNIDFSSEQDIEVSGKIVAGETATVKAENKIKNNGLIGAGIEINEAIAAHVKLEAASIENSGEVQSTGTITTKSETITNKQGGVIEADGDITVTASKSIENDKSEIKSGGDLTLQGANNQNSEQITNKAGTIEAKGDIIVKTDEFNNIGEDNPSDHEKTVEITGTPEEVEFTGGYAKKVKVGGYTWNKWGVMYEYQVESSLTTTPAYLLSGGSINIHNANLYNYGSLISAAGDIDIKGGSLKNETGAIKLQFDKYQLWGYKWEEKDCNWYNSCDKEIKYASLWKSGEVIAKSANPATIEAQGNINLETASITNTDSAGFEAISEEKKSVLPKSYAVRLPICLAA